VVLPDTSIWVGFFRNSPQAGADHLASLIAEGEVAVCGPVLAELLAGTREDQRPGLLETLLGLPWAELDLEAWLRVGETAARLRGSGTSLPLTDLTIAAAAVRGEHALWTDDSDFERIEAVLAGLRLYRPPAERP
jgi:predicted nucleic acid-binding protein